MPGPLDYWKKNFSKPAENTREKVFLGTAGKNAIFQKLTLELDCDALCQPLHEDQINHLLNEIRGCGNIAGGEYANAIIPTETKITFNDIQTIDFPRDTNPGGFGFKMSKPAADAVTSFFEHLAVLTLSRKPNYYRALQPKSPEEIMTPDEMKETLFALLGSLKALTLKRSMPEKVYLGAIAAFIVASHSDPKITAVEAFHEAKQILKSTISSSVTR